MLDVNAVGTFNGTLAALDVMRPAGSGHVINVISLAGLVAAPGEVAYGASKHAAMAFTIGTLADLRRSGVKGIDVSAVCPDGIWSPMLEDKLDDPDAAASFSGVMLTPERVAERISALLDSPRPVLTIPRWRGAFVRFFDAFPRLATRLMPLVMKDARRRQERFKRKLERQAPVTAGARRGAATTMAPRPRSTTPRAARCRSRPGCGCPPPGFGPAWARPPSAPGSCRPRSAGWDGGCGADWRVLELGSGRSTVWLARRSESVLAFEDNEHWLERARGLLADARHRQRRPARAFRSRASSPSSRRSRTRASTWSWSTSSSRPRPTASRPSARARSKVRPGGYLLLDDSDRPAYAEAYELLAGWRERRFAGVKDGWPQAVRDDDLPAPMPSPEIEGPPRGPLP